MLRAPADRRRSCALRAALTHSSNDWSRLMNEPSTTAPSAIVAIVAGKGTVSVQKQKDMRFLHGQFHLAL